LVRWKEQRYIEIAPEKEYKEKTRDPNQIACGGLSRETTANNQSGQVEKDDRKINVETKEYQIRENPPTVTSLPNTRKYSRRLQCKKEGYVY
jgi:hypothetical protein